MVKGRLTRAPAEGVLSRIEAMSSAKVKLDFILGNRTSMRKADRSGHMEEAADRFNDILKSGDDLTSNQLNYVDGMYERTMEGMGLPSVRLHADRKRGGLRYGR